jgi:hypothetical protein
MNFPHIKRHLSVAEIIEQYQNGEYGAELLLQHSVKHLLERKEEMRFKAAKGILELAYPLLRDDLTQDAIAEECAGMADALLSALYPSTEESSQGPDADGWIEHRPGDPIPKSGTRVRFRDGVEQNFESWSFEGDAPLWAHETKDESCHITHFKP